MAEEKKETPKSKDQTNPPTKSNNSSQTQPEKPPPASDYCFEDLHTGSK